MNLDTTIDFDLKGFFQWWGRELGFLVPKFLRQRLRDRHGLLIFTPQAQGFVLEFFDDEANLLLQQQIDWSAAVDFSEFKKRHPAIEKAQICLRLTPEQTLQKLIYLPVAVLENWQQVIGFEFDRYTPFSSEQVYFASILLGKTEQGQLQILLILAPKNKLDEKLLQLESLGIRTDKIDSQSVCQQFPQFSQSYNLLPERFRQQDSPLRKSIDWLAGLLLLGLSVAVLIWPVWMQGQAVESLKTGIKLLEKQNRVVDEQQREIDALLSETQNLIDIKSQSPALLLVLNELSHLLDDDTWLTHLNYSDKRMQIQGQSPAASALIGALEKSDFFSNVSFVSPLTQDKATGRERFKISLDVSMPTGLAVAVPDSGNKPEIDIEPQQPTTEEMNDQNLEAESGD